MARPRTFTIKDLPENWQEIVREHMGQGASVIEVIKEFGLKGYTREIHARMMTDYPEYHDEFEAGKVLSEAWWVKLGRDNVTNTKFNVGIYCFHMKNRFAWRDTPLAPKEADGGIFNDKTAQAEMIHKFMKKPEEKELEN